MTIAPANLTIISDMECPKNKNNYPEKNHYIITKILRENLTRPKNFNEHPPV